MKRASACVAGLVAFGGMWLLTGTSRSQAPGAAPPAPAVVQVRPTVAVFNMAAVMRDYGKAQYQVYLLNKKRNEMSADLVKWRSEYIKLQQDVQQQQVPDLRDKMAKQMLELARKIEDTDREVNKVLNDEATTIISQLYDDIKTVVDKTAEMNGYHLVFAYPDAVSPEEAKNPMIKELKLKPPAASPFFVAKQVDITGVVIQTLNAWYPAPPVPKDALAAPPATPATPATPPTQPQPKLP